MFWHHHSGLYDQNSFYKAFVKDIGAANYRVVIESPFITSNRLSYLLPMLESLVRRGVRVTVNTKPTEENDSLLADMATNGISCLQDIGVTVLLTSGHHRKLAVIDNDILWEGSLNILSQNESCEIMRRIDSSQVVKETINFLRLDRYYRVK